MVRCVDCRWFRYGDRGDNWDFDNCQHPICFTEITKEYSDERKAKYGVSTYIEKDRINDYGSLNRNNDCEYFESFRSDKPWWKFW